jgi:hypothetical protein
MADKVGRTGPPLDRKPSEAGKCFTGGGGHSRVHHRPTGARDGRAEVHRSPSRACRGNFRGSRTPWRGHDSPLSVNHRHSSANRSP